jgi:hypothetical protein
MGIVRVLANLGRRLAGEKPFEGSGRVVRQHAAFAPASKSGSVQGFALLSLRSRNRARSAFHTAFSPLCLRLIMQSLRVFEPFSLHLSLALIHKRKQPLPLLIHFLLHKGDLFFVEMVKPALEP